MKLSNILFLCTGNSCRSPIAEGLLRSTVSDRDVKVSSAGTHAFEGAPASENSIKAMELYDLDISSHEARQLTEEILREVDLVFAMASDHIEYVKKVFPKYFDKTYLLRRFGRENDHLMNEDVEDPIGGSIEQYLECYSLLDAEIKRIAEILFESG